MYSFRNLLILTFAILSAALPAAAQQVIATISVGAGPIGSRVDSGTNQIYVANNLGNTVMDVDGATNMVRCTLPVGSSPLGGDINRVTKTGYISNNGSNTVTVLSLSACSVITTLTVGAGPQGVEVNQTTNKIYVANRGNNDGTTVSVINGATNQVVKTITVGTAPRALGINQLTNRIYVSNRNTNTVSVIDGSTDTVIDTISGFGHPNDITVNPITNKIYVDDQDSNYITVIDGATDSTSNIAVGNRPYSIEANLVTNKIYVVNQNDNTVSVIDGASGTVIRTVPVGTTPSSVDVDAATNKIYVANSASNTVTMIDGATYATTTVNVGTSPQGVTVNPVTNRIYAANYGSNTVSVIAGANAAPLRFVPLTPCRVVDTRGPNGPFGGPPIQGGTYRSFPLPQGACNIPASAVAYSLNVTVVPHGALGYLTIWPTGEAQPGVSTMNSPDGRTKANAAIVPAGYQEEVSIYASNTTDVLLDVNGYFTAPGAQTYQFYPLTPCRVVDTRGTNGDLGGPFLSGGVQRNFPVLESPCIPTGITPTAYSLNMTAVPHPAHQRLGYLTVWPAGQQQPVVSTLNNPTGTIVANAAIVPAGTNGAIAVYPNNDTDLLIDTNGYFAAPGSGGLSLYTVAPCRVIDTRNVGSGQPFQGELTVNVVGSACAPSIAAQAFVLNATVVPPGALGYLTLWPDGENQPVVSTLNAADGSITSNMAIVPTNNGSIDAYASALTQLILDISSYFAP